MAIDLAEQSSSPNADLLSTSLSDNSKSVLDCMHCQELVVRTRVWSHELMFDQTFLLLPADLIIYHNIPGLSGTLCEPER